MPEDLGFAFNAASPTVIAWARRHAAELITQITDTSRARIAEAIVQLAQTGAWSLAHEKILKAVGDEDRATLIARHETMTAASFGQREAWDQAIEAGFLSPAVRRSWIAVGDEKVCQECETLDGTTATLQGPYPGRFEGPPAHVGCRCTEGIVG